jgi:hypothetical protein
MRDNSEVSERVLHENEKRFAIAAARIEQGWTSIEQEMMSAHPAHLSIH